MFVGELKGLHQAQGFINGTSHREVIDGDLPQHAFVINDEKTSKMERRIIGLMMSLEINIVIKNEKIIFNLDIPSIPVGNALIFLKHTIVSRYRTKGICHERNFHMS